MKKLIKTGISTIAITMAFFAAASATEGVKIEHLGINNTLVRVTPDSRYLLLPVQESNDDARINVLVDGNVTHTIYVRLAKTKVDYYVPFDLAPYKDSNLSMIVTTSQDRASVREAKDDACWTTIKTSDTFDTTNREKYRPAYHHTPLYGWMNDPNGMVYKDGVWHLNYQYNPYGSKWQNMTWGHSTSTDLVHWEHHPATIEPNGLGSVFSGSSAVDPTGSAGFGKDAIVAMYTSAGETQQQSLALSDDNGMTYHIYPGNPVLTLDSEARDPNMFWDAANNRWVLTLAHALEHEMLFFTSPDMKEWTLESSFGKGIGAQGGVWECPDLFELTIDGTGEKKWVLLCNLNPGGIFGGSATQYFVGDFDGKKFTADTDSDGNIPTKWLDFGKDHYATVSWSDAPDNRRTAIGWMSNWQYAAEVPTMQFRSANTLPREIGLFKAADGQIYASSTPSPELIALRDRLVAKKDGFNIGTKPRQINLPSANDGICEILVNLSVGKADSINLVLGNAKGEHVTLTYNAESKTLSFDRRESGITDFSQDFPAVTAAPTFDTDGKLSLRIFIDRSSIEVFEANGKFAMTNLVFPTIPYSTLSISADGGKARIDRVEIYSIAAE